jgi:hypothetical protein
VRDGIQHSSLRPRQRWRCSAPDGTFHRFLGALSVTRVEDGVCPTCERHHGPAEGPSTPWRHDYLVREMATALVAIGGGASYTDAAERVKAQAWGEKRQWHRKSSTNINGGLVADWLQQYGPVVAEAHAETEWPDTLVLDSTEFQYTDSWTGTKSRLFCVLFAYGYPSDGTRPRMWKVASSPSDSGQHWADFLSALPGKPRVVVCDDDTNIKSGVRTHWSRGRPIHIHSCEHHLYRRARNAMDTDKVPRDSPLHEALNHAFHSPEEWEVLGDKVRELGSPALQRWMRGKSRMMATQLARRGEIDVYANGAIEAPIRTVRQGIERRAWCFRNRARMDLLLEMMRLRLNKVDSVDAYGRLIRDHLTVTKGMPPSKRKQWDRRGTSSLRR